MTVPYSFASRTTAIPLSELDSNFNTPITLGNTAIQLGNTVTTLNNMTLANVTISSGNVTITNVSVTTANVTTLNVATSIVTSGETLSYGTANGVAYLNGSKVLTTGSALTFDGANVFGVTSSTTAVSKLFGGTGAGIGAYFSLYAQGANAAYVGTDSGITGAGTSNDLALYPTSTNNIRFYQGGSEQMRLTSTGLGIGTSSPAEKLNVNGNVRTEPGYGLVLQGSNKQYRLLEGGTGEFRVARYSTAGSYEAIPLILDASGNLGLGVTPSAWGTGSNVKAIQFGPASVIWNYSNYSYFGSNYYFDGTSRKYLQSTYATEYSQQLGQHVWYTAPSGTAGNAITFTQAMTLDASGNLLVGTSSQILSEKLSVTGTTSSVYSLFQQTSGITALYGVDGNGAFSGSYTNQPYIFRTNNTERMRIDSSGNVMVGGTSQLQSSKLTVYGRGWFGSGTSSGDGEITFSNYASATASNAISVRQDVGGANNDLKFLYFNSSGVYQGVAMQIDRSGNVGIGTSSPGTKLQVNGTVMANNYLFATNTSAPGTDAFLYRPGDNTLGFGTASTERMRIDSAGGVIIGATNTSSFGKLTVTDGLTVRGYNGSPSGNNSTTAYSNGGKGGTFSSVTIDINFNTTAATTGIVNLQLSGYNSIYLDYLFTFYAGTGFTSFVNSNEVRKTTGGVTVAFSVPSAGVARFVLTASVTHPVINLVVTSGGTNFVEPSSITYTYA